MDIVKFPIGADADAAVSIAGGKLVLMVELSLQKEVDSLLDAAAAKFPQVAALIEMAKVAADVELGKA